MALTRTGEESTTNEVMDNFKISGLSPDYVNIFRVDFLNSGQVLADLKIYGNKESRDENPDSHIKVEGTNILIPESVQSEIKSELFGKLYPYLEKMYQIRPILDSEKSEEQKKALIDELYATAGLDSPF